MGDSRLFQGEHTGQKWASGFHFYCLQFLFYKTLSQSECSFFNETLSQSEALYVVNGRLPIGVVLLAVKKDKIRTELKCIYSYFLKTHDFLQSILDILAPNKQFLKD